LTVPTGCRQLQNSLVLIFLPVAAAGANPPFDAAIDTLCEHRRSNPAIDVLDCHARPSCLP
jgi:hypothetical protein